MNLEVNGVYTSRSGCFAREIIAIDKGQISYRDFLLRDGQPLSSLRICSRSTFRHWASGTCTAAEIARFRRDAPPRGDERLFDMLSDVLSGIHTDTRSDLAQ
jgi:hypothetical protein